ncbi:hypothetical protein O181_112433 [Austropuccinia psidii MF-1]|uniref:Uncharacterized protein n=1 Tax=Austropuccinia psidii MF-1 TaxID=1389203 RepID=A0A9Q3PSP2_9BASI|nr:hypothetical protein [Austropuccinia psidii MF-1]
MTPTRSGSNYPIQSNGSGPGHSIQKSKRQECQPRGEEQMEDARTSTISQILARNFDIVIESPEADITAIPVVRSESFPTGSNRDIPVPLQELVCGGKAAGVGTSAKSLYSKNELLSSSEEVEKLKHVVRGPEEEVGPTKGQQSSGSSLSLKKLQTGTIQPQREIRRARKSKQKGEIQVEQALPTELQNSQEREYSHGQCVQYGNNSDGIQKQGGGKIEPITSK